MQSNDSDSESATGGSAHFASTHWSTILAAGHGASSQSREALERLCRTYWYPVYALVRHRGHSPEDAADLTQAFFERFIEKRFLKDVAPERGRFRTFLRTALAHFLANEWNRAGMAKRGGGQTLTSLDTAGAEERYRLEGDKSDSPERHYDRLWAETVMDHALEALGAESRRAGKTVQFEALVGFLSHPPEEGDYAAAGERLGLNRHAVAVAVARLRERYAALVRAEIARTVDHEADIETEVRYLIELVSQ